LGVIWLLTLASPWLAALPSHGAGLPRVGERLPSFELQAPVDAKERSYLGVKPSTFRLGDVACELLMLEVLGVYCQQCYKQAPLFNTLYSRIEKGKLRGRVKLLGLAAGGNPAEIVYLHQQGQYHFPVVPDADFSVHKLLGEPRTPFTMLIDATGKVLHTHQGVIEDIDAFFRLINQFLPPRP
jgi:hypothetical protein